MFPTVTKGAIIYSQVAPECHHVLPCVSIVSAFTAKCHQSVIMHCPVSPGYRHLQPGVTRVSQFIVRCHQRVSIFCKVRCPQSGIINCQVSIACHHFLRSEVSPEGHYLLPGVTKVSIFTARYHKSVTIYFQVSPVCHYLLPSVQIVLLFTAKCP